MYVGKKIILLALKVAKIYISVHTYVKLVTFIKIVYRVYQVNNTHSKKFYSIAYTWKIWKNVLCVFTNFLKISLGGRKYYFLPPRDYIRVPRRVEIIFPPAERPGPESITNFIPFRLYYKTFRNSISQKNSHFFLFRMEHSRAPWRNLEKFKAPLSC